MHLIVQNQRTDLTKLELREIYLFGENSKSVYWILSDDKDTQLSVRLKKVDNFFSMAQKAEAQTFYNAAFTIKKEIYDNPEKMVEFIKSCEVGVRYKYDDDKRAIEIDIEDNGFHWTYSNGWQNSYPMKNAHYIKIYKTDMGARLSLIKYLGLTK